MEVATAVDRCPSCGAGVRVDAAWCTLCYAPLRAPAEPAAAEAPRGRGAHAAGAAAAARSAGADSDPDPLALPVDQLELLTRAADVDAAPIPARRTGRHAQAPADDDARHSVPTWPCGSCGQLNTMDADACVHCFRPFLSEAAGSPLTLPLVGDLRRLSTGARYAWAFGVGLVVAGLIVGVVMLVGAVA